MLEAFAVGPSKGCFCSLRQKAMQFLCELWSLKNISPSQGQVFTWKPAAANPADEQALNWGSFRGPEHIQMLSSRMWTIKTEEGAGGDSLEVSPLRMMHSDHTTCILDCSFV